METVANVLLFLICIISAVLANANNSVYISESEDLLNVVKELKSDVKLLQKSDERQNGVIETLEHENKYLKDTLDKQDKIINELMTKIISLDKGQRNDVDNNDDDKIDKSIVAENISDVIEQRRIAIENSDRQIIPSLDRKRGVRAAETVQIAFSSYLTHGLSNLSFDGVIINDGNAYNPYSGMFTAPVTGTYMFFVIVTSSESDVTIRLMVNDIIQEGGTALPFQYNFAKDVQGTASVILRLYQGDSVWVENIYPGAVVWSVPHNRWTTFSGFRLY